MTLSYLESLKEALVADTNISGMVDGKIYKFKALEKSEPDLRAAAHKSLISCELKDWNGGRITSDPVFIVDIRSRMGDDGGAEYCSEIVKAVKELLDGGFGSGADAVIVSEIRGEIKFEKAVIAYRCRLEVFCHINASYTLSLYPSVASPQPAGTEVVFTAVASPAEGLEYRFLLQGPGTGSQWRDLSGWTARNAHSWKNVIEESTGFTPNVLILTPDVVVELKDNQDILSRIQYTQRGIITPEILASLFDVEKVLVPRGIYETAAKGATSAPARIAGSGKALLCYATNTPSIDEPSAGYFFAWKGLFGASAFGGRIKKFRVEEKAADRVEAEMAFDAKQIAPDLGLFASAVV